MHATPTFRTEENMNLKDALDKYGTIAWNCRGRSMKPLIRDGQDFVVISKPDREIIPYDIVIYEREGVDAESAAPTPEKKEYVLHRVMKKNGDEFIILGDNCITCEHVPAEQIIGVMTGLLRNGRIVDFDGIGYKTYVNLWVRPHRLRVGLTKARLAVKRACAKATNGRKKGTD